VNWFALILLKISHQAKFFLMIGLWRNDLFRFRTVRSIEHLRCQRRRLSCRTRHRDRLNYRAVRDNIYA